ncbi:hypothetical protein ColTof4_01874 [Colletotrichum tofieldiae]|uniref:Uncharacterized protein n=1 Tax=Colletotrichum liriopes TaxID=708192 RepID=A0AA37GKQ1_9PEZI|nr:hypothetical protein ColLi_05568 [Colletotrichum liriopes]GKT62501.1 hypothetical protein ColTof3_09840 [Colletotrichum tofieldiae]GKT69451.1 hypothetical protein ColTof4_01874 [Colletotrichum tofieldiae]
MGRSGYDTTGLGGFVRPHPRSAGGNKAGGGQKGAGSVVGPERAGQMQQAQTAAGSASASGKNRGGSAAPPKK